jgi:hypothetical protein
VKERIRCILVSSLVLLPSLAMAQDPPVRPEKPAVPAGESKPGDTKKPDAPATPVSRDARIRELETKVERLTRAIADMKAPPPPAPAPADKSDKSDKPAEPAAISTPPTPDPSRDLDPLRGIVVSGYVQAQLENHEDSEDQIRPGGATFNQNRFLIRRGRVKVEREWDYSSLMLEMDGNTTRGPAFQLFRAEAALMWRGNNPKPAPPLVKLTMGLFDVPFGYELTESSKGRYFMERSLQSRALFPAEPDLGIRLSGEISWFRYAFAVMNGEPLGTPNGFAAQDPNNHKDFVGHVGAFVTPTKESEVWGGVSMINGLGFVKGTDATKNLVVWTDTNEDRRISNDEIFGVPATAPSPSYTFERWAVGADLGFRFKTALGYSKAYGELQLGSNMDRALFVANPTISGQPSREVGYYLGLLQEITPYGMVGFRFDHYDPNADFLGFQSGKQVPRSQVMRTYSPLVAMAIPGRARLVFQYDYVSDSLGRTSDGLPTDLKNDQWTLRLQGEL